MAIEVKVPPAGESINTANVAHWHKQDGDLVIPGDVLVTLETDKVSNELEAEAAGQLNIVVEEGEEVDIGTVIAKIDESVTRSVPLTDLPAEDKASAEPVKNGGATEILDIVVPSAGESINSANVSQWRVSSGEYVEKGAVLVTLETDKVSNELEAEESGTIEIIIPEGEEVDIGTVIARLTVGAEATSKPSLQKDVSQDKALSPTPAVSATKQLAKPAIKPVVEERIKPDLSVVSTASKEELIEQKPDGRTTRKKMSMLRRKISTHLVNAQQTAAILTTFNEVDMSAIMGMRKLVQEDFVKKHEVKLGFMSFFTKAVVQALKDVPAINAQIDGTDIVQNHFYDIGIAIGTDKGLVVPVVEDCDQKSFAEIEKSIIAYAVKAKEGKITIEDLTGGVFTISNGGVYGSLLSTPILNPPQSGILGMHTIQQRPVAIDGKVEIRPMMNLALSYDHRLVDGKEAVTFLIKIKDLLENPAMLMLDM